MSVCLGMNSAFHAPLLGEGGWITFELASISLAGHEEVLSKSHTEIWKVQTHDDRYFLFS